MSNIPKTNQPIPRENCKLISCLIPDDGSDKILIRALHEEKNINRANSTSCMGLAVLADAKTKFDELPQPVLIRKVDVVVPEDEADELYEYIYDKARIGRPQGGVMWLHALSTVSPYDLPKNVPFE